MWEKWSVKKRGNNGRPVKYVIADRDKEKCNKSNNH